MRLYVLIYAFICTDICVYMYEQLLASAMNLHKYPHTDLPTSSCVQHTDLPIYSKKYQDILT